MVERFSFLTSKTLRQSMFLWKIIWPLCIFPVQKSLFVCAGGALPFLKICRFKKWCQICVIIFPFGIKIASFSHISSIFTIYYFNVVYFIFSGKLRSAWFSITLPTCVNLLLDSVNSANRISILVASCWYLSSNRKVHIFIYLLYDFKAAIHQCLLDLSL
jgi:hypothetical protein